MKRVIIERVNSLESKVDAVFLGYCICRSLRDIQALLKVPTVMVEGDDCIAALLTPQRYVEEKAKVSGTWFNSPGWAELGLDGVIKELHLDAAIDQGYEPMYFVKILFQGYSRCLFIDTGIPDSGEFEGRSKEFSDQLQLYHECTNCGLDALHAAWQKTKELASAIAEDRKDP